MGGFCCLILLLLGNPGACSGEHLFKKNRHGAGGFATNNFIRLSGLLERTRPAALAEWTSARSLCRSHGAVTTHCHSRIVVLLPASNPNNTPNPTTRRPTGGSFGRPAQIRAPHNEARRKSPFNRAGHALCCAAARALPRSTRERAVAMVTS